MPEPEAAPPGSGPAASDATPPSDWTANPSLERFHGDANKLGASYLEVLKGYSERVKIPGEQATEEERNHFYTQLGRPEKADGYKLELPAAPEGMTRDDKMLEEFLPVFYAAGLTQAQAQALAMAYAERDLARQTLTASENGAIRTENLAELEKAWGGAFKQQMALGDRAVQQWGDQELKDLLAEPVVGSNPAIRRFLAKIGALGIEARYFDAEAIGLQSHESVDKRIAEIQSHRAYSNNWDYPAEHDALMKELKGLLDQKANLGSPR